MDPNQTTPESERAEAAAELEHAHELEAQAAELARQAAEADAANQANAKAAAPAFNDTDPMLNRIKPNTVNADGSPKTPAELLQLLHGLRPYAEDPMIERTRPEDHARYVAEVAYLEHLVGART